MLELNPYSEEYVSGKKEIPEELPDAYAAGSREEAIIFATDIFGLGEVMKKRLDGLQFI